MQQEVVVILDNVRSQHNVGSIFRTADGAGVRKLYLVGTTPAPVDRFGRERPALGKTALGATLSVAWEKVGPDESEAADEAAGLIRRLQQDGYHIVAIEQAPNATPLHDFTPPPKIAYIFGAEVAGVAPGLLALADQIVEIPLHGKKESLNVSVTAGVVLFHC